MALSGQLYCLLIVPQHNTQSLLFFIRLKTDFCHPAFHILEAVKVGCDRVGIAWMQWKVYLRDYSGTLKGDIVFAEDRAQRAIQRK